jgi:RNA polymerase sigma-70 factor, ECF subfamily
MRRLYDEHAAALWRYAVRLTGDRARAEDVVQETLLRAWQHPEVTDGDRSARAWLFTVARNMIIDEQRSARFRSESATADPEQTYDRAGPDEVDSALDRMLLSGALAQLSPDHRAVIKRSYYQGWTTAQIRRRPRHRRRHREVQAALRPACAAAHVARNGVRRYTEIVAAQCFSQHSQSHPVRVSVGAVHTIGRGHRDSTQMTNHGDDDQSRLSLPVLLNECSRRR